MSEEVKNFWETIGLLFLVAAVVPFARAMASGAAPNWKVLIGRAVLNGVLGMSSLAVLLIFTAPSLALVGVACGLGTLGQSGVEHYARLFLEKKG